MDLIVSSVSGTCTRTERFRSEGKSLLFRIYRRDRHARHPVLPLAMEAGRYHRKLLQMVRFSSPLEPEGSRMTLIHVRLDYGGGKDLDMRECPRQQLEKEVCPGTILRIS